MILVRFSFHLGQSFSVTQLLSQFFLMRFLFSGAAVGGEECGSGFDSEISCPDTIQASCNLVVLRNLPMRAASRVPLFETNSCSQILKTRQPAFLKV